MEMRHGYFQELPEARTEFSKKYVDVKMPLGTSRGEGVDTSRHGNRYLSMLIDGASPRGIWSQYSQNLGGGKGVKKSFQTFGNRSRKFALQEWSEIEKQKIETYRFSTLLIQVCFHI